MRLIKLVPIRIKSLVLIFIIIFFFYTIPQNSTEYAVCSHLYNANSFERCALSNKSCNLSTLVNSYILYRHCVIEYSSTSATFVIFDAVNGLGNRALGLIAVTTYALVTGRVLLINWQPGDNHQASFEDLFLPLSSKDIIPEYHKYSLSRLASLIKNKWINYIESNTKQSRIPTDWAFYFDREMLCHSKTYSQSWSVRIGFSILNLITRRVKWIRTDQYFVPLLKRNKKTKHPFILLFQNGQVFSELAIKFLRPVPKVNLIVKNFLTKYNTKTNIVTIGVHMRTWSANMVDHIEPFQRCIEHVIKNITGSRKEEIKIDLYIISNNRKRQQKLASHVSKLYKNVKCLNAPETHLYANDIDKMQHTLAELLILSKMQYLIITSKSTFGMVAQGLAQTGAWIVNQGASQEVQSSYSDLCRWEPTSEPEYQMMGSLDTDNDCSSLPSIGERIIV